MSFNLDASAGLWVLSTLQIWGIASAWLARISEGSVHQTLCQRLFFLSLLLMGAATIASLALQPMYWLGSGVTLAMMILVVICDFRRSKASEFFTTGL